MSNDEKSVEELSNVLLTARKDKGYSLQKASIKTGISHSFISQLERGKRPIPIPKILRQFAEGYNLDYEYLMVKAGYLDEPRKNVNADKNEIFVSDEGMGEFKMLKKYTNSNSDKNGITSVSNNGFDFNFSYMLIQDVSTDEKYLAYFGEIVNNTDKKLEFLNKVKIVTDTGEQLTPEFGIGTGALNEDLESGSKVKGFHKVELEYDDEIPKQIGVTIDKVDDNENREHYGDVQKLQLSTDGKPKENVALPTDM